ncbi:tol-pal system-associated acyl-CoA thioesterase [Rhodocyclaceae bacterium SMB388]
MNDSDQRTRAKLAVPFELQLRVYYEDTDAAGVVYYANYLRFCERARTEALRTLGFEQGRLLAEKGIGFVVRSVQATFIRPARLDDPLLIASTVTRLGGASLEFDQKVLRGAELLFDSRISIACVDTLRQRPTAIPPELRTLLTQHVPQP